MPEEGYVNDFATTLTAAVATTGATSISVAASAPTGLQGTQFRIRVDSELMLVTATGALGATPWTVTRGVEGSTASTHANAATVTHVLTAASAEALAPRRLDYRERTSSYTVTETTANATGVITELVCPALTGRGFAVAVNAQFFAALVSSAANKVLRGYVLYNVNGGAFTQLGVDAAISSPSTAIGMFLGWTENLTLVADDVYIFKVGAYKETGDTATIAKATLEVVER